MPSYPAIYRARAFQVNGIAIQALIPQVFGESPVTISSFLGNRPAYPTMGYVLFQGGNPEFPVWAGNLISAAAETAGGGSETSLFITRDYRWRNNITAVDPGHGFVQCNQLDPATATFVYMSLYDTTDTAYMMATTLLAGDLMSVYLDGNIDTRVEWMLTGPPVNNGAWLTIPVSLAANYGFRSGIPGNNAAVKAVVQVTGHAAPTQPMPGGATGDIIVKQSAAQGDAQWTTALPKLNVTSLTAVALNSLNPAFTVGALTSSNVAYSATAIQARSAAAAASLAINPLGGAVSMGGALTITPVSTDLALILNTGLSANEGAQARWSGAPGQSGFDIDNYNGGLRVLQAGATGGVGFSVSSTGVTTVNSLVNGGALTNSGQITVNGNLRAASGGEAITIPTLSAYIAWWNGATRIGYIQANTNGLLINSENGQLLRLMGTGGINVSPATINGYTLSEGAIGYRVVCSDQYGYIHGNYIDMSANLETGDPARIAGSGGDGYMRWYSHINANRITWNSAVGGDLQSLICTRDSSDNAGTKSWGYSQYRSHAAAGVNTAVSQIAFWVPYANAAPMVGSFTATAEAIRCTNSANDGHVPVYALSYITGPSLRETKERIVPLAADALLDRMSQVPLFSFRRKGRPKRLRLRKDVEPRYNEDHVIINDDAEDWDICDHDCAIDSCVGTDTEDDPCPEMVGANATLGFMADDLGKVFPELAPQNEDRVPGYIETSQVAQVAFAGVGALFDRIKTLTDRVAALELGSAHGAE